MSQYFIKEKISEKLIVLDIFPTKNHYGPISWKNPVNKVKIIFWDYCDFENFEENLIYLFISKHQHKFE